MKKIFALFFAVLFVVSFSGCGKSDAPDVPQYTDLELETADIVKGLQLKMKDPASFRIYGDVTVVEMDNGAGAAGCTYALSIDAKNSFGAYTGASGAEITVLPTSGFVYAFEDSDAGESYVEYLDIVSLIKKYEDAGFDIYAQGLIKSISTVSGETVAEILGVEFYEVR